MLREPESASEDNALYDPLEDEDPARFKATVLVFIFCTLSADNIGSLSFSEYYTFLCWTHNDILIFDVALSALNVDCAPLFYWFLKAPEL